MSKEAPVTDQLSAVRDQIADAMTEVTHKAKTLTDESKKSAHTLRRKAQDHGLNTTSTSNLKGRRAKYAFAAFAVVVLIAVLRR